MAARAGTWEDMRLHLGFGLLAFTLVELVGPDVAQAATANCMSPDGTCEVNNDAGDFTSCECADGIGVATGGGNEWAGLSEVELQPICDAQLAALCGPPPPPEGIPCMSPAGSCVIDNVPEDSLSCECADGSGGGLAGGNAWAGLSDVELAMQCEVELASLCGGAPPPPPPPPPVLECSSGLGSCVIGNEPIDFLECECTSAPGFGGGGGTDWAGLSDEELLMLCEDMLADGCTVGSETGDTGETSDTGETGDTEGGEGSTGDATTGQPGGETGLDGSGGASEGSSGDAPPPATTGDDATGGSETGDDGAGGGGGGGGGCRVAPRQASSGLALVLLGLVGLGRRRRRGA